MPTLAVATAQVRGAATRMTGLSSELKGSAGDVRSAADAAADTPAEGAYDALMSKMTRAVGVYGASVEELALAMRTAAECYEQADQMSSPLDAPIPGLGG